MWKSSTPSTCGNQVHLQHVEESSTPCHMWEPSTPPHMWESTTPPNMWESNTPLHAGIKYTFHLWENQAQFPRVGNQAHIPQAGESSTPRHM